MISRISHRMFRRVRPAVVAVLAATMCAAWLALPAPAMADEPLRGTVVDASGAVVPGAAVRITARATGQAVTTTTDARGAFEVQNLATGSYDVQVRATGFEPVTRTDVVIERGDRDVDRAGEAELNAGGAALTIMLNVAGQTAVVDVTAPAPISDDWRRVIERPNTGDVAALLNGVPGVSLAANGGVATLPIVHGLADDRVKMSINGMTLTSACSSHMNPPLSYLDPAALASIKVMAGITPVSGGGDSIGGTIIADSPRPEFAATGVAVHASVTAYGRSNGNASGGHATFSAATEHLRVSYTGAYTDADNYSAGGGVTVKSTFYTTVNHALQMAARRGQQTLTAHVNVQRIPEQGFANARMDMTRNDATLGSLRYEALLPRGRVEASGYYERTSHEMNILRDKIPGMNMPMETTGDNLGYTVGVQRVIGERDTLRLGSELHRFRLDDWWPGVMPMVGSMGPDALQNVNNGRRTRVGTYGEWEAHRGAWTTQAGLRSDIVSMNTGDVTGYNMSPTATGSGAYYADAVEFNARDHARRDYNVDGTFMARLAPTPTTTFEVGYARKTRSPNLYERYLWVKRSNMSVQMNGWFGDANGYTGNLDLRPEVAHTLSATTGWHGRDSREREVVVTPYVTRVNDYIDVDRCAVIAGSNGCTAAKLAATTGFVNLQFANHDARLYGVDVSGRLALGRLPGAGAFALNGTLNYVRGRILDTADNMYRLMPLDTRITFEHRRAGWTNAVTLQAVAAKERVQAARNELTTPGYALLNLSTGYQFRLLRLSVGVDNLTDRRYVLPLGGRYWIGDTAGGSALPGMGRSVSIGATVRM